MQEGVPWRTQIRNKVSVPNINCRWALLVQWNTRSKKNN